MKALRWDCAQVAPELVERPGRLEEVGSEEGRRPGENGKGRVRRACK